MTMEELKKAGETMRMACKNKQPITDEQMKMIQDGEFPDDRTSKVNPCRDGKNHLKYKFFIIFP